jgi:hypothetical protein
MFQQRTLLRCTCSSQQTRWQMSHQQWTRAQGQALRQVVPQALLQASLAVRSVALPGAKTTRSCSAVLAVG